MAEKSRRKSAIVLAIIINAKITNKAGTKKAEIKQKAIDEAVAEQKQKLMQKKAPTATKNAEIGQGLLF